MICEAEGWGGVYIELKGVNLYYLSSVLALLGRQVFISKVIYMWDIVSFVRNFYSTFNKS